LAAALEVDVLELLSADAAVTLAALRARHGLTQGAVAAQLGISRSLYAAVEQGRRPVSDAEATKLATVRAVDADRLRRALPT
jgi:transcriptional regulator with XRE-family HTH domain